MCECPTKTTTRDQAPFLDVLGPFADEMVTTSIDRLLYLLGADKLQKYFGCCDDEPDCECKEENDKCKPPPCKDRRVKIDCRADPDACMAPCCACVKACSCVCSKTVAPCLRRSFSLCSLACRRLKEKLTCPAVNDATYCCPAVKQPKCGQKQISGCKCQPKWLWTSVRCAEQGVKIYEVYPESSINVNPHNMRKSSEKLIFIVMPNGCIMPFESVPSHN